MSLNTYQITKTLLSFIRILGVVYDFILFCYIAITAESIQQLLILLIHLIHVPSGSVINIWNVSIPR